MRRPIKRDSCPSLTLNLPDDIIEHILNFIPPVQLCASGWEAVSRGFADFVEQRLSKCSTWSTRDEPFFFTNLVRESINEDAPSLHSVERLLRVLTRRLLPYVHHLDVDAAVFTTLEVLVAESENVVFRGLHSLKIRVGEGCGRLGACDLLDGVGALSRLLSSVRHIELEILVSEKRAVTCNEVRSLARFLRRQLVPQIHDVKWNVRLEDATDTGQGWVSPSDFVSLRDLYFVSFVRALADAGVTISRLVLVDLRQISPYMLVMTNNRRTLYMYEEYKACEELTVCYDVGLVAPSLSHASELHGSLRSVTLQSSHVLYKDDFLDYLKNCPNLETLRIVLPMNWRRRTSRCKLGCFQNEDFSCFRESGWSRSTLLLPYTSIHFECSCRDNDEPFESSLPHCT